jgi:sulfur-oxidizing protein SoxB
MQYSCEPAQVIGRRIGGMVLRGKPVDADRTYKVVSWAPVGEDASGKPVWDLVAGYLRDRKTVSPSPLNRPRLIGVADNPGIAAQAR